MKKKITLTLLSFWISFSYAEDLLDVYQQALHYDPSFKAAYYTRLSQGETVPQARASLLPLINANANVARNNIKVSNSGSGSSSSTFNSHSYALNLTQPIFDYAAWTTLRSARATDKQAQATYDAALQDLMIRTAKAYFAVLEAEDNLGYTLAEKRANAKQLDQARQRFKVGLDPITSVYDAQARYDAVVASEISARTALENSKESLREITGEFYSDLSRVNRNLPLVKPTPAEAMPWVKAAEQHNYGLLATRYASVAAREAIKTNFAGHLPTVDAVANYTSSTDFAPSNANNADIALQNASNASNTFTNSSIGLQMTIPIYQGGQVVSQTQQARYNYKTAVANLDRTHRSVVSSTHQTFNNIISGVSQVEADRQAVRSAATSLSSTEESFKVGVRTFVDVLNAQRDLYSAQRKFAHDQYAYLNSILALKQAAGTLSVKDLAVINSWLTAKRKDY